VTSKRTTLFLFTTILLLGSSCGIQVQQAASTSTAFLVTSTLPPIANPAASETPLPPPPQPTVVPVEGTSSTQINVRSEPSTSGSVLGMIPPDTKVQIVAKDPGGNWWQILYEQGVDGKGWVTAQYITASNVDAIPVIGGNAQDPNNANMAVVQQQINVRSGPGTSFNSLGTLNAQDVVNLTGKDSNGAWLQIAFTAGPDGKGWVNAAFVRAQGVENLPIITEAGQVVGTGTPTGIPATPTATIVPAWADNDSLSNPIVNVNFEPDGTHTLIYTGDVSTPQGDPEDWVNFRPHTETVLASLTCTGTNSLQAAVLENGMPTNFTINCGDDNQRVRVNKDASYSVHFYIEPPGGALHYIRYTIKIQSSP
jgi:uncharacterized protein YraI